MIALLLVPQMVGRAIVQGWESQGALCHGILGPQIALIQPYSVVHLSAIHSVPLLRKYTKLEEMSLYIPVHHLPPSASVHHRTRFRPIYIQLHGRCYSQTIYFVDLSLQK